MSEDYGALTGLVAVVGSLVAGGAAIIAGWTGDGRWAPPLSDLAEGLRRVAVLPVIGAIVYLWSLSRDDLRDWAINSAVAATIAFLVYLFLMLSHVHNVVVVDANGTPKRGRVIGGFFMKNEARHHMAAAKHVEELLEGSQYNPKLIWPTWTLALVSTILALAYLVLMASGSIAVASAALYFDPESARAGN